MEDTKYTKNGEISKLYKQIIVGSPTYKNPKFSSRANGIVPHLSGYVCMCLCVIFACFGVRNQTPNVVKVHLNITGIIIFPMIA